MNFSGQEGDWDENTLSWWTWALLVSVVMQIQGMVSRRRMVPIWGQNALIIANVFGIIFQETVYVIAEVISTEIIDEEIRTVYHHWRCGTSVLKEDGLNALFPRWLHGSTVAMKMSSIIWHKCLRVAGYSGNFHTITSVGTLRNLYRSRNGFGTCVFRLSEKWRQLETTL